MYARQFLSKSVVKQPQVNRSYQICLRSSKSRCCVRRYLPGRVGAHLQCPSGEVLAKVRQHFSCHQPTGAAALQSRYFRSVNPDLPLCPVSLAEPTHVLHLHRRRTSNSMTDASGNLKTLSFPERRPPSHRLEAAHGSEILPLSQPSAFPWSPVMAEVGNGLDDRP